MTEAEKREAARLFYSKWHGKGKEDEDDRSYWLDILQRILGVDDATDRVEFQKKVIVNGSTKRIDVYIPETKVIIEQKSLGIDLEKKSIQSGGIMLTPYEQAKRYNDNLPISEKAKWIVTSNFSEIYVYDMDTVIPEQNVTKIQLDDLKDKYTLLDFLITKKVKKVTLELELSLQAGELVGKIYDAFLKQYANPDSAESLHSLNVLCVRLVFCLYAEDAGLFGMKNAFTKYISQYEPKNIRTALIELFKVLDANYEDRKSMYLDDELSSFPYCNGGLFADVNIEIPRITQEIKDTIIEASQFSWEKISPTIFGGVFESTLNPETRRKGGMHYTSIENIHKVIDPLFLDDLKEELAEIKKINVKRIKDKRLHVFQDKLASLKFLDPAAGSGNFLTETFLSLRRLENEVIKELIGPRIQFADETITPIKVSISQFYGIEINDFAVTVAKTALWIAESQMIRETEDIVLMAIDFLPLKTNANIVEGNALRLDWNDIINKEELSYILGNPPFVGAMWSKGRQREDIEKVFPECEKIGQIDYVAGWYAKAAKMICNTQIRCALVSTNSICQGQQVGLIWKPLFSTYNIKFDFAYRTFRWDSEANIKAHVHCIIIGFSHVSVRSTKRIYDGNSVCEVSNINGYLNDASDIYIMGDKKQISGMPTMHMGVMARDGGNLIMNEEEYNEYIKAEPQGKVFIHPYMMGKEFLNKIPRYCFWLLGADPSTLKSCPLLLERIEKVRITRLASPAKETQKLAETPAVFAQLNQPKGNFLAFPKVSSEKRRYIPIGFMDKETIVGDKLYVVENVGLYHFGILTSNVHNSWMRVVAGRLKSDYSYSNTIVYNSFPWPTPTEEQKINIEKTAQAILDARAMFPKSSLADLYDPLTMPKELKKAHIENDKAVMQAYGFDVKTTSETDCVSYLMRMYQELQSK